MRVLVVEDDAKIANALKKGLMQQSYAVDVCFDGVEGLAYAKEHSYEVIILDRMLPSMDGIKVIDELRKAQITTPILMLTAKDSVLDRTSGLNAGADDYLIKPFAFIELLARIRALARRPYQTNSSVLAYGDLMLDSVKFEVFRANQPINLSKKEFALLEYMMKNPEMILTKEMIIENVWNFEADILPNTVEVYIGYLRKKIDKPFSKKNSLIHTLRGFGYRLGEVKNV